MIAYDPMNAHEAAVVSDVASAVELGKRERKLIKFFLFATLLLLPIPFGGVHERTYLPFSLLLSSVLLFVALREPQRFGGVFSGASGRASQLVSCSLAAMLIYTAVQYWAFSYTSFNHPVVGKATRQIDLGVFVTGWREIVNFLGIFLLARLYLGESRSAQKSLARVIMLSGGIVSLIAISHWLYDNGMLFWIFEPETNSTNRRARWPFVNPNHLGDFLSPIFFLTLGGVVTLVNRLFEREITRGRRRNRTLVALISSEDFHVKVMKPIVLCLPLLSISLALLGSQSRGAWFGTSVALLVFTFFSSSQPVKEEFTAGQTVIHMDTRRRSRGGRSVGALKMDGSWALLLVETVKKFIKPLVITAAALVVLFFLNSQGRDLVAGRLEYGLLYSMEDIRWTFYADSWRMFIEHPIFGVGLGAWEKTYSPYASPALAGLNPVYLHSDPYQLLIELGIVGFLPLALIVTAVLTSGIYAIRRQRPLETRLPVLATFCGLIAFSIATLPEFPMRIPAISALVAAFLAFFLAQTESRPERRSIEELVSIEPG